MIFSHLLHFVLALCVIWILSGSIVSAIDRVAKRYHKPGFAVAFFVLGLMTSISEIAVAVNATIEGVPQVSAGNLVGASIVIFLLIVPVLAIFSGKIDLDHTVLWSNLLIALCVITVPALIALDGTVMRSEGLLLLFLYIALIYRIRKKRPFEQTVESTVQEVREELIHSRRATMKDLWNIGGGALLIFLAGNVLVEESVFFSDLVNIPSSMAGLLLLAIGTNTPELIIAIRSVLSRHTDIAFGDYLGSAAANSLVFSVLALVNGTFLVASGEFVISFLVLATGLALFAVFGRTKNHLSRGEGAVMLVLYCLFVLFQIYTLI